MKVRHLKRNALPRNYTGHNTQWVRRRRRKDRVDVKNKRFAAYKRTWGIP